MRTPYACLDRRDSAKGVPADLEWQWGDTFRDAGLLDAFHLAAAHIYKRLASFQEYDEPPTIEAVLSVLLQGE